MNYLVDLWLKTWKDNDQSKQNDDVVMAPISSAKCHCFFVTLFDSKKIIDTLKIYLANILSLW